jgi:GNAT superfamily N-acetyltransferase
MLRGPGEIRAGSLNDLNRLAICGENKYQKFLERFQAGDHCVVAQLGAGIIGYEWFSIRPRHVAEPFKYRITVPCDCIYAYDAFILPEYRGSGVWLRFKSHLAALMEDLGRRRVLTYVEQGNELSLASHFRLGFKPVKLVFVSNIWA